MDSMNQLSGYQSLIYKAVKDSFTLHLTTDWPGVRALT